MIDRCSSCQGVQRWCAATRGGQAEVAFGSYDFLCRLRRRGCNTGGTALDAANVRRGFRQALSKADGVDPADWTPRELRHSFVSLLSDSGVPLEETSRLVGHSSTAVTEEVYRKQIRPVIQSGAIAMDSIFQSDPDS